MAPEVNFLTAEALDLRIDGIAHALIDQHNADQEAAQSQEPADSALVTAFRALDASTLKGKILTVDGDNVAAMSLEEFGKSLESTNSQITGPIERAIPSIGGVNLGSVAVGVVAGVVVGEAINAFVSEKQLRPNGMLKLDKDGNPIASITNSLVKLGAAAVIAQFGGTFMSRPAGTSAITALAVQVISNHVDLKAFASNIANTFRGDDSAASSQNAVSQAQEIVRASQARLPGDIGNDADEINDVFGG